MCGFFAFLPKAINSWSSASRCSTSAKAFGGFGVTVTEDKDVPAALDAALAAIDKDGVFGLIHLVMKQRIKTYSTTS